MRALLVFRGLSVLLSFLALGLAGCAKKTSGSLAEASLGRFTDVTTQAGFVWRHGFFKYRGPQQAVTGGVACADYDRDGFPDLCWVSGDYEGNVLYRNKGDGTFEDVSDRAGVRLLGGAWCGATFVDMNGDGWLDLFLAGVVDSPPCVLLNKQDGTFADASVGSGVDAIQTDTLSPTFADYDKDGDLDLFITQWGTSRKKNERTQHLWANDGLARFRDVSAETGISRILSGGTDYTDMSFTANFVDIDGDTWLDLLITGDLGKTFALRNVDIGGGKRGFRDVSTAVLRSEHASGAAIGDYDNDGDLDWFVSGVFREKGSVSGPLSGNRLLRNIGGGAFEDVTDEAGVREGGFGWAASFADLNNDGHVDLVQVNGFGTSPIGDFKEFYRDPARLFLANGDGTFADRAAELRFDETGLGRGVVCFDYDRDGDCDIFVANLLGKPTLWRNDLTSVGSYLTVSLVFAPGNPRGIGARIRVTAGGRTQVRELRVGSHYVSQNPAEAHFGLGDAELVDKLEIRWPDGSTTTRRNVEPNQLLRFVR